MKKDFTLLHAECVDGLIIDYDETRKMYFIEACWWLLFDVDEYFDIKTTEDSYLNMYSRYYEDGSIDVYLVIDEFEGVKDLPWSFSEKEKQYIKNKMQEYSQRCSNCSLEDQLFIIKSKDEFSISGDCKDALEFIKGVLLNCDYNYEETMKCLKDFEAEVSYYDQMEEMKFLEALSAGNIPSIYMWYSGLITTTDYLNSWFGTTDVK